MSITAPVDFDSAHERLGLDDIEIVHAADDLSIVPDVPTVTVPDPDQQLVPFLFTGVITLLAMLVIASFLAL